MWVLRGILIALSLALAGFLIWHGNVVIGVLIGAMAIVRIVLLTRMHSRREEIRRRLAARRRGMPSGRQ